VAIPGYADLRSFSVDHAAVLRDNMGGAWRSYLQRGNWRMIFPFGPRQLAREARRMADSIHADRPVVAHLQEFPALGLNHAVVLFRSEESAEGIRFEAYDPNRPDAILEVWWRRATKGFEMPATAYFPGGGMKAYEVYRNAWY
jgi:hypothetical protein